jgi:rhodanese-related sulfurtransferase
MVFPGKKEDNFTMQETINAEKLNQIIQQGDRPQIIDVSPYSEFVTSHIQDSFNLPIFDLSQSAEKIDKNRSAYLVCRRGVTASQAARQLEKVGIANTYVLESGIKEWVESGLPVVGGKSEVWSLERQTRLTASVLVLIGILLAFFVNLSFIIISLFVAAGLIYSAITNTCAMAMVLARFPWNQAPK